MTTFGEALRAFRHASNDPHRLNRRLSQERLGRLMGEEMGDLGFTGAAVAYWESGESKISMEDRTVLLNLIKVLHICGGLKTLTDANQFLELGNYRILDGGEAQTIFPELTPDESSHSAAKNLSGSSLPFLLQNFLAVSEEELNMLIAKAKEEGPEPSWPRVLAAFMRKAVDRISITLTMILWVWVGVAAWWLMAPSLRLPFEGRSDMLLAVTKYVIGTLVIPLAIGALVNTKDNEYWKEQSGVNPALLRLYTHQGAGIGFNLGYFFIYPLALARYYLDIDSSTWVEIAAVWAALILGNMAARVVPHNLWRAYGRLTLADGAIFFVIALLGPLWGFFFVEFSSILLAPVTGVLVILLAVTILVIRERRRSKHKA